MAKSLLSMELPKVGDKLKRVMSRNAREGGAKCIAEDCVVTYVNNSHGWYEVTFPTFGIKEAYGLPTFDHAILEGNPRDCIPVICVETGFVYPSIAECSRDMRLDRTGIWKQLDGVASHCGGYHFAVAF